MQEILNDINNDFFISNEPSLIGTMIENGVVDKEAIASKWLGFPPASEQDILTMEKQLGVALPPSCREFFLTSNGFRHVSFFLDNLFPLEKIDWAKNTEDQWWFDMLESYETEVPDDKYFVYGEEQRSEWCRDEYLKHSLKVAEWCDGMCVFINPVVKHGEEWEVLEYATWFPGTRRYRSFKEYLTETHKSNLRLQNKDINRS
jgi:hypothetical protein